MSRRSQLGLLATTLVLAAPVGAQAKQHQPYQHVPNAVAEGSRGAAASVDSVATNAALEVLKRQGNAVDAAIAAAAVLGVTEPFSAGVGGGGFMVIRTPDGDVTTIDSREESPAAMEPDSFYPAGTRSTPRATPVSRRACRVRSPAGRRRSTSTARGASSACSRRPSTSPARAS